MLISVIIPTLNEEANLPDCLASLGDLPDEVIVCDMHSDDRTVEIARAHGARVIFHERAGYVEPAREFAASQARHEWILMLDADERLSPDLRDEIAALLGKAGSHDAVPDDPACVAYSTPILNWMFGKFARYGSWRHEAPERLYRRGALHWSSVIHQGPQVDGPAGRLRHPILHYSHTSIGRFIDKLNRYTDVEAADMFREGRRVRLPLAAFGAVRAFLGQYVRLQGFRDGGHGLILALLMAGYFFVARAKLWSLWYQHDHPPAPPR